MPYKSTNRVVIQDGFGTGADPYVCGTPGIANHVPQNLIRAIVDANRTRKDFLSDQILMRGPKVVGIHRLKAKGVEVIVYEPVLEEDHFFHSRVIRDLEVFKGEADLIVANRLTDEIRDVSGKVFTRDLFGED